MNRLHFDTYGLNPSCLQLKRIKRLTPVDVRSAAILLHHYSLVLQNTEYKRLFFMHIAELVTTEAEQESNLIVLSI